MRSYKTLLRNIVEGDDASEAMRLLSRLEPDVRVDVLAARALRLGIADLQGDGHSLALETSLRMTSLLRAIYDATDRELKSVGLGMPPRPIRRSENNEDQMQQLAGRLSTALRQHPRQKPLDELIANPTFRQGVDTFQLVAFPFDATFVATIDAIAAERSATLPATQFTAR